MVRRQLQFVLTLDTGMEFNLSCQACSGQGEHLGRQQWDALPSAAIF